MDGPWLTPYRIKRGQSGRAHPAAIPIMTPVGIIWGVREAARVLGIPRDTIHNQLARNKQGYHTDFRYLEQS